MNELLEQIREIITNKGDYRSLVNNFFNHLPPNESASPKEIIRCLIEFSKLIPFVYKNEYFNHFQSCVNYYQTWRDWFVTNANQSIIPNEGWQNFLETSQNVLTSGNINDLSATLTELECYLKLSELDLNPSGVKIFLEWLKDQSLTQSAIRQIFAIFHSKIPSFKENETFKTCLVTLLPTVYKRLLLSEDNHAWISNYLSNLEKTIDHFLRSNNIELAKLLIPTLITIAEKSSSKIEILNIRFKEAWLNENWQIAIDSCKELLKLNDCENIIVKYYALISATILLNNKSFCENQLCVLYNNQNSNEDLGSLKYYIEQIFLAADILYYFGKHAAAQAYYDLLYTLLNTPDDEVRQEKILLNLERPLAYTITKRLIKTFPEILNYRRVICERRLNVNDVRAPIYSSERLNELFSNRFIHRVTKLRKQKSKTKKWFDRVYSQNTANRVDQEYMQTYHDAIQDRMDVFIKDIVNDNLKVLGPAPCEWGLALHGSRGRRSATWMSDIEYMFLIRISESQEVMPDIIKQYFCKLSQLIQFTIAFLEKSNHGFNTDIAGNVPFPFSKKDEKSPYFILLGQKQIPGITTINDHFRMPDSILNARSLEDIVNKTDLAGANDGIICLSNLLDMRLIIGEPSLKTAYKVAILGQLYKRKNQYTLSEIIGLTLIYPDVKMKTFCKDKTHQLTSYNIKTDALALLDRLTKCLLLYNHLLTNFETSTVERIRVLKEQGIISEVIAFGWEQAFWFFIRLRQIIHLNNEGEDEIYLDEYNKHENIVRYSLTNTDMLTLLAYYDKIIKPTNHLMKLFLKNALIIQDHKEKLSSSKIFRVSLTSISDLSKIDIELSVDILRGLLFYELLVKTVSSSDIPDLAEVLYHVPEKDGTRLNVEIAKKKWDQLLENEFTEAFDEKHIELLQKNNRVLIVWATENGIVKRLLRTNIAEQLLQENGLWSSEQAREIHGRRQVKPLHQNGKLIAYAKYQPEFGGAQIAAQALRSAIGGEEEQATLCHFIPLLDSERKYATYVHQKSYSVLLSSPAGETLQKLAQRDPNRITEIEGQLSHYHTSKAFFSELITSPEDHKPDNVAVKPINNEQTSFKLTFFDTDRLFADEIEVVGTERVANVKTVVYLLSQMYETVDSQAHLEFLSLEPYACLDATWRKIIKIHEKYSNFFSNSSPEVVFDNDAVLRLAPGIQIHLTQQHLKILRQNTTSTFSCIPLLLHYGTLAIMFQKFLRAQQRLSDSMTIALKPTLIDILSEDHPTLCDIYKKAFDPNENLLSRMRMLSSNYVNTATNANASEVPVLLSTTRTMFTLQTIPFLLGTEALNYSSSLNRIFETLKIVSYFYYDRKIILNKLLSGEHIDLNNMPFIESIIEFIISQIDFDTIQPTANMTILQIQEKILDTIVGIRFKKLRLINCHALTDSRLSMMLKHFPELELLDISGSKNSLLLGHFTPNLAYYCGKTLRTLIVDQSTVIVINEFSTTFPSSLFYDEGRFLFLETLSTHGCHIQKAKVTSKRLDLMTLTLDLFILMYKDRLRSNREVINAWFAKQETEKKIRKHSDPSSYDPFFYSYLDFHRMRDDVRSALYFHINIAKVYYANQQFLKAFKIFRLIPDIAKETESLIIEARINCIFKNFDRAAELYELAKADFELAVQYCNHYDGRLPIISFRIEKILLEQSVNNGRFSLLPDNVTFDLKLTHDFEKSLILPKPYNTIDPKTPRKYVARFYLGLFYFKERNAIHSAIDCYKILKLYRNMPGVSQLLNLMEINMKKELLPTTSPTKDARLFKPSSPELTLRSGIYITFMSGNSAKALTTSYKEQVYYDDAICLGTDVAGQRLIFSDRYHGFFHFCACAENSRFYSIALSYIQISSVLVFVFKKQTGIDNVTRSWIDFVKSQVDSPILLVSRGQGSFPFDEGVREAKKIGAFGYFETSDDISELNRVIEAIALIAAAPGEYLKALFSCGMNEIANYLKAFGNDTSEAELLSLWNQCLEKPYQSVQLNTLINPPELEPGTIHNIEGSKKF